MHRSARVLFCFAAGALVRAQPPAPAASSEPPRLRLEDAFLAGASLPERVEVNGRIIVVADLVRQARESDVADRQIARHCLEQVVLSVLQEQLEQQKAWLDDETYEAAYAEYARPYDETPFTVSVVATKFKGYPGLSAFQQRWRVVESLARSLPKDALDDKALAAEAGRSRDLLGGSGIEVELWFHEAAAGEFGQRDFAAARQRAETTRAALAAAKDGKPELATDVVYAHLGGDRPLMLNQLRTQLRESEYTALLREGVAEALFRATPGELMPPLRGADGVWVARVVRKVEGKGPPGLENARTRELLRQLLVEYRFREWVDATFAKSVVRVPRERSVGGTRQRAR